MQAVKNHVVKIRQGSYEAGTHLISGFCTALGSGFPTA